MATLLVLLGAHAQKVRYVFAFLCVYARLLLLMSLPFLSAPCTCFVGGSPETATADPRPDTSVPLPPTGA